MNIAHLPEKISPEIISFGDFFLSWYAVCYLCGTIISLGIFARMIRRQFFPTISSGKLFDLLLWIACSALIGARVGYVLVYHPSYYLEYPIAIISPFDPITGRWIGIAGMSFHGAVVGVGIAAWIFSRRENLSIWAMLDALALAAPSALFFGRMGNFLSGELFGRPTEMPWGMIFPLATDTSLRHPSQLYEALGEGLVLFLGMLLLMRWIRTPGMLVVAFLIGYGCIRFFLEFFREPDSGIGFFVGEYTLGQGLSFLMIVGGILAGAWILRKKYDTLMV